MPRQQNEGGRAAWIVTHAASPSDSKVPTRGSCHRVIASQCRACVEAHHAAVEANEADHGVDISRCVSTNDRVRTHTPARSSRQFMGEIDGLATCGVARSLPHRLISGRARIARVSGGQPWTSSASAKTSVSQSAQRTIDRAVEECHRRRHALLTNEHIFFAFAQQESARSPTRCTGLR